jgi:hypothetical protein
MSSVTRFIRQIPVATTYYDAAIIVANASTHAFEFVPTSGNYVGNYPPGFVQNSASLDAAIVDASNNNNNEVLLRDMGKTIYAEAFDSNATSLNKGYFRQVQLIAPKPISASQGFLGGPNGSTFGVIGGPLNPNNYTNYLTFYIPVTIGGVGLPIAATTGAFAIAGGQM